MPRILIATMPVPGHVAPMRMVASKLVERGNEVVWYGSQFFQAQIESTGARFMPIKSALDYGDSDYDKYFPGRAKTKDFAQIKFDFKHLFIDAVEGQVKDIKQILADFKADVLIGDPAVVAGKLVAEEASLPWAVLNISVLGLASRDVPPFGLGMLPNYTPLGRVRNAALYWLAENVFFRDVQQYADRVMDRNGWKRFPFRPTASPYLYLQPSVAAFEYPRTDLPPQLHFIGPLIPNPPSKFEPPDWWGQVTRGDKRVVLVTQGTIATNAEQLIVPTLQALADEDVLVVAATGGKKGDELGMKVPANAFVTPFIPFATIMPYVSTFVTNGGYGGITIALANGVPVVSGGTTEDKPEVSNRVAYTGVGINLKTSSPKPEQVRAAVREVLTNESYRVKARHMQGQLVLHDAATEAAQLLEKLAVTRQPVLAKLPEEARAVGWQQLVGAEG